MVSSVAYENIYEGLESPLLEVRKISYQVKKKKKSQVT